MGLETGMLVLSVLIKVSDFPLPNLVDFLKPKWLLNRAVQVPVGIVTLIKSKHSRENPKGIFRDSYLKADFWLKDPSKLELSDRSVPLLKKDNFYYLKKLNTFDGAAPTASTVCL